MIATYNMDCMEYLKGCKDKAFDLAIVDPPYGINQDSHRANNRTKLTKSKKYHGALWNMGAPSPEYFTELKRVSKNQIIFGANHFIDRMPFGSSCWIVWDKCNPNTHYADCELAYTSFKTAVRKVAIRWNGMIQHDMKNKEARVHPTQKPVALYRWLLENYAKPGDIILDTHLGSGSSALAAWDLNFTFFGTEIDPQYYADFELRFEKHKVSTINFNCI